MADQEPLAPAATAAGGRWKTWALVLSLGLNIFVAAVVAGAALRHPPPPHDGGIRDIGFGPYTAALSPEDRAALREAFLAAAPDFRTKRDEMREDIARLAASLRAEPWDEAATEAILMRQGAEFAERLALGRKLFVERIAAMSAEERQALADRIEKAAPHRMHDRKTRDDD